VELKPRMKNKFVANGLQRWSTARAEKSRDDIHKNTADKNERVSFLGKIRLWFKTELAVLRDKKADEKTSPKILW